MSAVVCVMARAGLAAQVKPSPRAGGDVLIQVEEPRPLAAAAAQLEKQFGWTITYEDPAWVFSGDIDDVTASVRRDGDMTKRVLVPRSARLVFVYNESELNALNSNARAQSVLESLVQRSAASGNPGGFVVRRSGNVFSIVPEMAKTKNGAFAAHASILDVRISLPAGERSLSEQIQMIAAAVARASNTRVLVGVTPINLLRQSRVDGAAQSEVARDVLLRAVTSTKSAISWQLFYQPGDNSFFVLNLHIVSDR